MSINAWPKLNLGATVDLRAKHFRFTKTVTVVALIPHTAMYGVGFVDEHGDTYFMREFDATYPSASELDRPPRRV